MANDKNDKKIKKEKKHFFKDFKAELKRVTWPTGKQLVNNTIAVITIVFITAAIVFVLDIAFEMLNKYGINKLKSSIINNQTNTVVEDNNTTPAPEENTDTTNGQEEGNEEATSTDTTPSPETQQ